MSERHDDALDEAFTLPPLKSERYTVAAVSEVASLRAEVERLKGERDRVLALWPHIEVPDGPMRFLHGKRSTKDPGSPTCLRCKIEEAIRG